MTNLHDAIRLLRAVTLAPLRYPHLGVRVHYKNFMYPILWRTHTFYQTANRCREYDVLRRIANDTDKHVAKLVELNLLYQCHIKRPVCAIYTAIPMRYKHWYTCSYERFVADVVAIDNCR